MNDTRPTDPDTRRPADDHAVTRRRYPFRAHVAVATCSGALLPARQGGGA